MDKTAIKNFAIWARKKLIGDISYKASLLGITPDRICSALPQSTREIEFYDIGLQEPYAISGKEIEQRRHLAELIRQKEQSSDYATAYNSVIEEVAYTWFNRLIAVRFMEVNDYLPSHTRILSSDSKNKLEPDIVTNPFDTELTFTEKEKEQIIQWQHENAMDSLFMLLFIKACNALNELLPQLFEKTADYTELLLNLSVTDRDGVVYRLVHDIPEEDFDVEQGGQVEIIGWLYQYYNAELKDETFALLKKNVKITKERIPSATQLFTPHWIVQYMVENSLGRLWVEGHPNEELKQNWKYYLEEAKQEPEVEEQLKEIRKEYAGLNPEDIRCMDPCMGSGHILVYMFDVLLQIYGACGYTMREAVASIVQNNLWGLDIDERAAQLAYFAVMMKARQYDRRFLTRGIVPHVYAIHETNALGGAYDYDMGDFLLSKEYQDTLNYLLEAFIDAKEYGSILQLENRDYRGLERAWVYTAEHTTGNAGLTLWQHAVAPEIPHLIKQAVALSQKYHVVVTNPPYVNSSGMSLKLSGFVTQHYVDSKSDLFACFIEQCNSLVLKYGFNSIVTMQSWMFLTRFEQMRIKNLSSYNIVNLMHMENMVLGIAFGTVVTNFRNVFIDSYKGVFNQIKLRDIIDDKPAVFPNLNNRYAQVSTKNFSKIPGMPVAYWLSQKMFDHYANARTMEYYGHPKVGMQTSNNEKYLRYWFEINYDEFQGNSFGLKWIKYLKGGAARKWYGNLEYLLRYNRNPQYILQQRNARVLDLSFLEKKKCTWTDLTSGMLSFRYAPEDTFYDISGHCFFPDDSNQFWLLAYANSKVFSELKRVFNSTYHCQVGDVQKIIVPKLNKDEIISVSEISRKTVELSKQDWDAYETSWDFKVHPLIPIYMEQNEIRINSLHLDEQVNSNTLLSNLFVDWKHECEERYSILKENEETLNKFFIDNYGLQDELTPDVADNEVTVRKADYQRDIRSLISYAVGCMFGRYSLDRNGLAYAGGEWEYDSYKTFKPDEDNVIPITDEEYFDDDIVGVFCKWLVAVYGADTLEENLDFIAGALGNSGNTSREIIRNYFLKDFYKDHCKIYQKRPIYWMFDSGKQNGFKALIYLHRYDKDTIGNMRAEYLHRMEHVYESEINRMNALAEQSDVQREAANARKRAEKLQKQLRECREYDEKVGHLAIDRIELDLDDGVKVNYEKLQTDRNGNKYQILAKI